MLICFLNSTSGFLYIYYIHIYNIYIYIYILYTYIYIHTCIQVYQLVNSHYLCFTPQEEIRKEWMFKLVGKETFTVGAANTKATINIDAVGGFAYEYTLEINGKSLKKYMENRLKTTNTWILSLGGTDYRVVLGESAFSGFLLLSLNTLVCVE